MHTVNYSSCGSPEPVQATGSADPMTKSRRWRLTQAVGPPSSQRAETCNSVPSQRLHCAQRLQSHSLGAGKEDWTLQREACALGDPQGFWNKPCQPASRVQLQLPPAQSWKQQQWQFWSLPAPAAAQTAEPEATAARIRRLSSQLQEGGNLHPTRSSWLHDVQRPRPRNLGAGLGITDPRVEEPCTQHPGSLRPALTVSASGSAAAGTCAWHTAVVVQHGPCPQTPAAKTPGPDASKAPKSGSRSCVCRGAGIRCSAP